MIFTFWSAPDRTAADAPGPTAPSCAADWRASVRNFHVFDDSAAIEALSALDPAAASLYTRIRLPACRSDIARLALLHRHGGLYVDAHTGTADPWRLAELFDKLVSRDALIFDRVEERAEGEDIQVINTCLCARPRSSAIGAILATAIAELRGHAEAEERTSGYVPYNVAALTGVGAMLRALFVYGERGYRLRPEVSDTVEVVPLVPTPAELPFHMYKHYGYRQPNGHWSERQRSERLFA